jgi:predicted NBD/HSP70 family sugar kinase
MRRSTAVREASCGIDLQAQTMEVGLFNRDGKIMPHRKMPTTPEVFLKAMASSR